MLERERGGGFVARVVEEVLRLGEPRPLEAPRGQSVRSRLRFRAGVQNGGKDEEQRTAQARRCTEEHAG